MSLPYNKRVDGLGHVEVPVVEQEGVVPAEVAGEGGGQAARAGDNADVSTVAERLRPAAADRLRAVGADPPHVALNIPHAVELVVE